MKLLPRSMAQRVALVCALGCVLSGATVALVTGLLAARQTARQEDAHLREALATYVQELEEHGVDPWQLTAHERHEIEHSGMVLALFTAGGLLAGDTSLPEVAPGTCVDISRLRACGQAQGSRVAVIGRDQHTRREQAEATTSSALIAVGATSLLATLAAFLVARALTLPLAQLASAVQRVRDPGEAELGPDAQISELDALKQSLQGAFHRLDVALTQARSFARNAAHQLRTPLTAVLGELELAQEQLGARSSDELSRAHRVAARLSVQVDRLLILAQPEDRPLVGAEVELLEVVEDAIDTLPLAQRRRVTHALSSLTVLGDHVLLTAALANALENALKFSDAAVQVGLARHDGRALIWVQDEGPGVSASEREQVFAPFYRARSMHAVPGHGVGLAVIAHVLRRHGGAARFVDCQRGARLELSLPAA